MTIGEMIDDGVRAVYEAGARPYSVYMHPDDKRKFEGEFGMSIRNYGTAEAWNKLLCLPPHPEPGGLRVVLYHTPYGQVHICADGRIEPGTLYVLDEIGAEDADAVLAESIAAEDGWMPVTS